MYDKKLEEIQDILTCLVMQIEQELETIDPRNLHDFQYIKNKIDNLTITNNNSITSGQSHDK